MQFEVYQGYVDQFKDEEIMVNNEPNISEKQKESEKREKEELKKLEKLFKKETSEIDETYSSQSLKGEAKFKAMKERMLKTIKESSKQDFALQKMLSNSDELNQ